MYYIPSLDSTRAGGSCGAYGISSYCKPNGILTSIEVNAIDEIDAAYFASITPNDHQSSSSTSSADLI